MLKRRGATTGCVYRLWNIHNGKSYIGKTVRYLTERIRAHAATKDGTYFKRALDKYGIKSFVAEVLESNVPIGELDEAERKWIRAYESTRSDKGYNLTIGGTGGPQTAEVRARISAAVTGPRHGKFGKPLSAETRRRISEGIKGDKNWNYGRVRDDRMRRKLSSACRVPRKEGRVDGNGAVLPANVYWRAGRKHSAYLVVGIAFKKRYKKCYNTLEEAVSRLPDLHAWISEQEPDPINKNV